MKGSSFNQSLCRLLVIGLVTLAFVQPVVAAQPPTDEQSEDSIDVEYQIHRLPDSEGVVRVTAIVEVPDRVRQLSVELPPNATFQEYRGFDATGHRWEWDETSETARLSYTVPVGFRTTFGQRTADTEEWTLIVREEVALSARWHWRDGPDPGWTETMVVPAGETGVGSATAAYLGPYETVSRETATGTIQLVIPNAATLHADPDDVLDILASAQRTTTVGTAHDHLTIFVTPEWLAPGGYTPSNGEPVALVNAREPVAHPANVWAHEYQHMRQSFRTTPEMAWLTEGSAEYYAAVQTLRSGHIGYDRFRARITTVRYQQADLSAPHTWTDTAVQYDKGARTVAALDARIQQATGYERSFADVLTILGRHDEPVTLAAFVATVTTVAGEPLNEAVQLAITGRAPPVPDMPHALTVEGTADHDDDGLDNAAEWRYGSHPFRADTDGDGRADGVELQAGTDPVLPQSEGSIAESRRVAPRRTPHRYQAATEQQSVDRSTATPAHYAVSSPDTGGESQSPHPITQSPLPLLLGTVALTVAGLGLWWHRWRR